jgi:2-oxoglutarate ferredoxin oxidoreductase subunit alpha
MTDLDIGMNQRLCALLSLGRQRAVRPRQGDDPRRCWKPASDFGRYLDVDGDGIPYRTYPGTHPTKGAYFTRGTTATPTRATARRAMDYIDNMERLLRKFETAKSWCRQPVRAAPAGTTRDSA